jgi:methionine-gamma-lyase
MSDHSSHTTGVHAGRHDLADQGTHAPPLDRSTTYPIRDLDRGSESIESLSDGGRPKGNSVYQRLHNPTVARFEEAMAEMEGAEAAVAFGSGMAAVTASLLAAKQKGRHIVGVRPLYGGTDHLLGSGLLDVEVTWAQPDRLEAAVESDTSLVFIETPANPTLKLVDIQTVVRQAGEVPVLVDSTFATPALQRPLSHGAALSLHSATKFIGGHGDLMGGVVCGSEPWARRLRRVRNATGGSIEPRGAYDLHRGLQTLSVRMERAQQTAGELVGRLAEHPAVSTVHYPGFDGPREREIVDRQMAGPGTMVAFELAAGYEAAVSVMHDVSLITPAVSLGSTDTLIQHPAGLTHKSVDEEARKTCGITEGLMRLSVGLEDLDDLWEDLQVALPSGE